MTHPDANKVPNPANEVLLYYHPPSPPPLMCPPFGLARHFIHACMCGLIIFCSLYHSPVVFLRFPPFPMLVKKPTSLKNPKLMWSTQTLTGQFNIELHNKGLAIGRNITFI